MGNTLHEAIHNKVVTPALQQRHHMMRGRIITYNNIHNMATVEFNNPKGSGKRVLDNVPLQLGSGGVHSAGPFPGDMVWISFLHGNEANARITSLADEDYANNTRAGRLNHERKGNYLPDLLP